MRRISAAFIILTIFSTAAFTDQPIPEANSDPVYRQLRDIGIGTEAVAVEGFTLKRDAANFNFKQGVFSFLSPVNGKITGAVFSGEGEFVLMPPVTYERHALSQLTKKGEPGMTETFKTLTLRFTDGTADEIRKAATRANMNSGDPSGALHRSQDHARKRLHENFDARILQDVLSTTPGGYFVAFIEGQKYSGEMLFVIDPHGISGLVAPEEIALITYADTKSGIWTAFHFSDEYAKGTARGTEENTAFDIANQNLDTAIEKSGYLKGNALTTVTSNVSDLRAVHFDLFHTLRVRSVTDEAGNKLSFVQEDKDRDPDFWVVLPKGVSKGEKIVIRTIYEGKEAVTSEGSGNYYPVARDNWYPNGRFGRYATYQLRFSVPKRLQLVATGDLVSQKQEGDQNVSVWKSDVPLAVAGFNLGDFKRLDADSPKGGYKVESYANKEPPSAIQALKNYAEGSLPTQGFSNPELALGSMETTMLMKKPLAEAQLAMSLYDDFFGPASYKRVAMTQQPACSFGQSWPTLVYLPICSFYDSTVRHQLGLDDTRGYWTTVAPHEVAHQWWGHTVGFNSYRDQWMSEGFAEFSASLFVQYIWNDNGKYMKGWRDQFELMTEKNAEGFRAIDVGPLTAGYRLGNSRVGHYVTRRLIYPKGAFVLHMIRMMMWDRKNGDDAFRDMMHDFVKTYANRPASTEDFKAMVEKHMTPSMNVTNNRKMDWFFDEYIYGTELPTYKLDSNFMVDDKGVTVFKFKLSQSNVSDTFSMLVPIYIELADGRMVRLGSATVTGNKSVEQSVPLGALPQMPKRAVLNYNFDVLATVN